MRSSKPYRPSVQSQKLTEEASKALEDVMTSGDASAYLMPQEIIEILQLWMHEEEDAAEKVGASLMAMKKATEQFSEFGFGEVADADVEKVRGEEELGIRERKY